MKNVVVIGAGASGMVAAYAAAKNGNRVTVLERNEKAGKKIYITGKGRCNITNDCLPETFLENVVHNSKFLFGTVHSFSPQRTMRFFEEGGLALKVERGNRVFPMSDKASDVTKCLLRYCENVGVVFRFNATVLAFNTIDSGKFKILFDGLKGRDVIYADAVIVCTGGLSYPSTGSTGDGYAFAADFSLNIITPRPALCGINCDMSGLDFLQGLSLKNVRVSAVDHDKELFSYFGEMMFTHYGISGPAVLSLSSRLNESVLSNISIKIDLKPALDKDVLDKRILRDLEKYKNKQMRHALEELLPKSMIVPVLIQSGISPALAANSLTRIQREHLCRTLKGFQLKPLALRPIDEAIVTAGGIDVKELNPKTMECRKVKNLYFCGECIDVDALTGGFNLQIAFMTGYAAGSAV